MHTPKTTTFLPSCGLRIKSTAQIKQFFLSNLNLFVLIANRQCDHCHLVKSHPTCAAPSSPAALQPPPLIKTETSYRKIPVPPLSSTSPKKGWERYLQMPSGLCLHHLDFCLDAPKLTTAREKVLLSEDEDCFTDFGESRERVSGKRNHRGWHSFVYRQISWQHAQGRTDKSL